MMELVLFLTQNPQLIVTVVALLLSCFLIWMMYRQWAKRTEQSEVKYAEAAGKFDGRAASIEANIDVLSKQISDHREAMGMATKAISGEMLKTKEQLFEMRKGLTEEVEKIKAFTAEVHRNMILANEVSKIAIESLNDKLGRVIMLEKNVNEMKDNFGKVKTANDETNAELVRQKQWFKQVGEALNVQKKALNSIREDLNAQTKKSLD